MILYKKQKRLVGVFYGGQGFSNEKRILTDWYDEDDITFNEKVKSVYQKFDYFDDIIIQENLIRVEIIK